MEALDFFKNNKNNSSAFEEEENGPCWWADWDECPLVSYDTEVLLFKDGSGIIMATGEMVEEPYPIGIWNGSDRLPLEEG